MIYVFLCCVVNCIVCTSVDYYLLRKLHISDINVLVYFTLLHPQNALKKRLSHAEKRTNKHTAIHIKIQKHLLL